MMDALASLSPATRSWFERAFGAPTPAQELAWPAIATGAHVLVQAPTGSGKTLAAFLQGIDRLNDTPGEGLRLLYVSPLKALNYDIERNLRGPLAGLRSELVVGVRTGDTPQRDRQRMLRRPPDVLITTPESGRKATGDGTILAVGATPGEAYQAFDWGDAWTFHNESMRAYGLEAFRARWTRLVDEVREA